MMIFINAEIDKMPKYWSYDILYVKHIIFKKNSHANCFLNTAF